MTSPDPQQARVEAAAKVLAYNQHPQAEQWWAQLPIETKWGYRTTASRMLAAADRVDPRPDADLLMWCDSLLSLIRYREPVRLSEQTIRDLDSLLPALRRRTNEIAKGTSL